MATKGLHDRTRQTIYIGTTIMQRIDRQFKEAALALHPQKLDKVDYLEACFKVAMNHLDEVQTIIARRAQEHEPH